MRDKTIQTTDMDFEGQHYYTLRYTFLGIAFGLLFPAIATLIALWYRELPFSLAAILDVQNTEPLLWIIDSAPIILGLFASFAGRREDRLRQSRMQLVEMVDSLEERVGERTRDLDRAVEVGRSVTQVSNLDQMLTDAVDLIHSSFDLDGVQVYLLDKPGRNLLFKANAGSFESTQLIQRSTIPMGLGSIIGTAAIEKQTIVVAGSVASDLYPADPSLSDAWSKMAVPMRIGDLVVGVLDLRSDSPGKLTAANLPALEIVAGQLAIAIEHIRLVSEATEAREEIEAQASRMAHDRWQGFLNAVDRSEQLGYAYQSGSITPIKGTQGVDELGFSVPIHVMGQPVGAIQVQEPEGKSLSEDEVELVSSVARQVAQQVESLRLLAETERYRQEAENATRRLTREGWQEYLKTRAEHQLGFAYDSNSVVTLPAEPDGDSVDIPSLSQELTVLGETIGHLEVTQTQKSDDDATELISAVAEQLSTHLENLRLTERTEHALANTEDQARRLAALNELGQALAGAATLDEVYRITAKQVSKIVPSDRTSIAIYDQDEDTFEILALHGVEAVSGVGDIVSGEGSILGVAVKENRVVVINQTADSSIPGIESFLVAPLRAGGRTFGTVNIGSQGADVFDTQDERLLLQVASLLASIMESRRLFSETEKRAEELAILNEMGQALASQMDMNGVIESVYRHSARLIGSDSLYVALYDEAQDEVAIRVYGEGEEAEGTTLRRVAGKGITEHVIKSRQPLLMSEDVGSRVKELGIETHGRLAESWLGVPMMTGNQVSGIIAVQSFNKQLIFDEHHRDLLTAVASQAAIAIENARLFAQVQARARRERILQELTARVRGAADVDTIMRTAAQEVGQALGREAFVYISKESTDQPEEDPEES